MAAASARAVAVAFSGGRDSTALLHATARAARAAGVVVHALHVHHGLSQQADAWLAHCAAQCAAWEGAGLPVRLHAERVKVPRRGGQSLEAQARSARYAALARMAKAAGCRIVLLAHHRRDQAETFLLQALRGAGMAGLAAMPAQREDPREGILWCRPWLQQPSAAIAAYVAEHGLAHIEDDSNADVRHARNRLRLQVWPVLEAAFPGADQPLALAARWAQEAQAGLAALAGLDAAQAVDARGALSLRSLAALGAVRGRNLLRYWLCERLALPPSAAAFERLWHEVHGSGPARWPLGAAGELRRYRARLSWAAAPQVRGGGHRPSSAAVPIAPVALPVARAGRHRVDAWGGQLIVRRVAQHGVALHRLARLELRPRTGGERFQRAAGTPPRALKKQFQAAGIAAWEREAPLFYVDGELVYVPGLGVDARAWATAGEAQVSLDWQALPALAGGAGSQAN